MLPLKIKVILQAVVIINKSLRYLISLQSLDLG